MKYKDLKKGDTVICHLPSKTAEGSLVRQSKVRFTGLTWWFRCADKMVERNAVFLHDLTTGVRYVELADVQLNDNIHSVFRDGQKIFG